jgi:hypothetical protein
VQDLLFGRTFDMSRSLIPTVVVALLVILFAGTTEAQSGASLAGTVADENGAVVINAEVQLLSLASGRSFISKSGSDGKYELTGYRSVLIKRLSTARAFPLQHDVLPCAAGLAHIPKTSCWCPVLSRVVSPLLPVRVTHESPLKPHKL